MIALVVPKGDYETQAKMLDEISELDHVTSVLGIASVEVMDGYRLGDEAHHHRRVFRACRA